MAIRYIGNKDSDGTSLGQSNSDLVSFHGVTPIARATVATLATNATLGTVRTSVRSILAALKAKGLIV